MTADISGTVGDSMSDLTAEEERYLRHITDLIAREQEIYRDKVVLSNVSGQDHRDVRDAVRTEICPTVRFLSEEGKAYSQPRFAVEDGKSQAVLICKKVMSRMHQANGEYYDAGTGQGGSTWRDRVVFWNTFNATIKSAIKHHRSYVVTEIRTLVQKCR